MQRTPETIKSVIVADKPSKSFHIALSVLKNTFDKDVITKALIDSGASINCLDWGFIKSNKIPYHRLPQLIHAKNIDGSDNKSGIIHRTLFHIINCGNENIILGTPWLEKINPIIDWAEGTVNIPNHTDRTPDYNWKNKIVQGNTTTAPTHANVLPKEYIREKPTYADENFIKYLQRENIAPPINKFRKMDGKFAAVQVCKTTIATELTREVGMMEVKLPEWYEEFSSVFSEEEAHCFPPSWPYNHTINLDDSFIPKVGKIYPLTPKEQMATEDFLEENLQLGRICPLNSPQAASFFFIDKKDTSDTLWPCQDYWYVNTHTIKDAYLLPLIQNLIDQVKDAKVFTKFDIRWGYNNICIQDGDQWKVAFITHKGLFESMVMFFGLCNSPTTFQRFMNDLFRDMITEGWLVVYMDDLLISSPNHHLDTERTKWVLQELDLHLKIKKCKFGVSHIDYLGMILSPGQIEMDPTKLNGIRNWPTPTSVKDIRSFLGFTNFYRKFIGDYSNIAHPILDLTKKDTPWNWNNSCQNAFNRLKNCFLTKPVLHLQNLHHCHRHFQIHIRWCTPANRLQWRVAPILLLIPIVWSSRTKLRHLRQRTPCYHSWPQDLAPLPTRIIVPSTGLHWPQKSHILQASTETQQETGPMDVGPSRLWPQTHTCSWEQALYPRCLILTTWSNPKNRQQQWRGHPSSPIPIHKPHQHWPQQENCKVLGERPLGTQCPPSPWRGSPHPIQILPFRLVLWCRNPRLPGLSIPTWLRQYQMGHCQTTPWPSDHQTPRLPKNLPTHLSGILVAQDGPIHPKIHRRLLYLLTKQNEHAPYGTTPEPHSLGTTLPFKQISYDLITGLPLLMPSWS